MCQEVSHVHLKPPSLLPRRCHLQLHTRLDLATMSLLNTVGQTRPGRLADQPPLTAETAAAAAASAGSHGTPEQEVQRALQGHKVDALALHLG